MIFSRYDIYFIIALLIVCVVTSFVGIAIPIGSFAHDTFFFLDNSYRIIQGQIPHRDFSSAWGPVIFLIDATGLILSGMRPAGIGYANALFGALISIWTFITVRSGCQPKYAFIIGFYTILLITAPFPLGNNPFDFGIAMTYNRYGYAIFGVVLVECFSNMLPLNSRLRRGMAGAVSTGVALGLLLFLKITYASIAIAFTGVCMMGSAPYRLQRTIWLFAGFIIISLVILLYMRFDFHDILQDFEMVARARGGSLHPMNLLHTQVIIQNIPLLAFGGFLYKYRIILKINNIIQLRILSLLVITTIAGCLLLITNQQTDTFPMNGYATVMLAAVLESKTKDITDFPRFWPVLWMTLSILPMSLNNAVSLADATLEQEWPTRAHVAALNSPERGKELVFAPVLGTQKTATDGEEYVEAVNDGLDLLSRHSGSHEGILVFDMFNPFNYLLNLPSPKGGFAAVAYNYFFSEAVHPTADRFFGSANYVLVRKYKNAEADRDAEDGDVVGLMHIYGSTLRVRFAVIEETEHWTLWHLR